MQREVTANVTMIPEGLKALPQWVVWRYEEREGKTTKVPYNATSNTMASSTDSATWETFEEVLAASRNGDWNGVGFVFTEDDPFTGVDLDNCRHAVTEEIKPWARKIVDRLNSYTEVTPSGTGFHVICRGALPPGRRRKGDLEMYDSSRYFTVTGEHLEGTPLAIQERPRELAALHLQTFGAPKTTPATAVAAPPSLALDDASLLEKARTAKDGAKFTALMGGDWSGYESQSEADQALCNILAFWTGHDAERMDRLFRQSGLYREKWDSPRGDSTYGRNTIEGAIAFSSDTYQQKRPTDNGESPGDADDAGHPDAGHGETLHLTDMGNAGRLIRLHGRDLHYCTVWGKWLVWDGTRWRIDDTDKVYRMAKETALLIYEEAARGGTEAERKAIAAHAVRSESQGKIEAMVGLAASEGGIPVRPDDLDADPWLFNVANGTVDLRTGDLGPHRRGDLITKAAPVVHDTDARYPQFAHFMMRVMGASGKANLITYVQRTLGRCLTGDVTEHRLEMWYGVGANGKTTLMNAVRDVMGDYARMAAPGLLLGKHNDRHPTEIADLKGARFVGSVEVGENRKLAEELVKQLTGGDRLKARFMRQDFWEFEPTHKLVVACNHKPTVRGSDHAIWRRIRLVPFDVIIPDHEQDKNLGAKLRAERSGILNWLVKGCLGWQREGLTDPNEVKTATADYRAEQDTIASFIEDCCNADENQKTTSAALYTAYSDWCKTTHEEQVSKRGFGLRLAEQGYVRGKEKGGKRLWFGLGLVAQEPLIPDREGT